MAVYVGQTDPYWEIRRARQLGESIGSAITMVSQMKQKKQDRISKQWDNAIELMKTDPESAKAMLQSMQQRNPKLLEQMGYDAERMVDIADGRIVSGQQQQAGWDQFGNQVTSYLNELATLRKQAEAMPDVIEEGPPQPVMTPFGVMPMPATSPNPRKAEMMAAIDELDDPQLVGQVSLNSLDPKTRVQLDMFMADKGVDLSELGYAINFDKLDQDVYTLRAAKGFLQDPELLEAARVSAGLEMAPADKQKFAFDQRLAEIKNELDIKEIEARGKESRQTEELRQAGTRERLGLTRENIELQMAGAGSTSRAKGESSAARAKTAEDVWKQFPDLSKRDVPITAADRRAIQQQAEEDYELFKQAPGGEDLTYEDVLYLSIQDWIDEYMSTEGLEEISPATNRVLSGGG